MVDENESLDDIESTEGMDQSIPDSESLESWSERITAAKENTSQFSAAVEYLGGISGTTGQHLNQTTSSIREYSKAIQEQGQAKNQINLARHINTDGLKRSLLTVQEDVQGTFSSLGQYKEDLSKLFGASAPLVVNLSAERALKQVNAVSGGAIDMISKIMELNKHAITTGVSFGKSFSEGADSINQLRERTVETTSTLYATEEEIKAIRGSFKDTLDVSDQVASIEGLNKAQEALGSTLSLTNVAFAASKALGMDSKEMADILAKSVTELGEDHKGAATSIGVMRKAGEDSGLGFGIVSKSIMESADSLKMWGGTIGAVAPLFNSFAESITTRYGIGRRGLTPQLLKSFVDGLQGMSFSTRALMGIQAGGAGKGAIGAGLEMEAALEKGDYGKIIEGVTETMKQFGGGQIVTREEAIENPALERNFMVQRQLLQQQLNLDQASATRMMGAIQDMDKNGVSSIENQEDALAEIMGAGRTVQETQVDILKQQTSTLDGTIQSSGSNIVKAIQSLADEFGVGDVVRTAIEANKAVVQRGSIDIEEDVKNVKTQWQATKTAEEQELLEEKKGAREEVQTESQARDRGSKIPVDMKPELDQSVNGKIIEGVTETMKQFGGGQIVTREEAIENPALERNFMVQRQLLQQQLNLDQASATRMMGAIQDMDKTGTQMGIARVSSAKSRDPFASGEFERREQQEAQKPRLTQEQVANWGSMSEQDKRQAVEDATQKPTEQPSPLAGTQMGIAQEVNTGRKAVEDATQKPTEQPSPLAGTQMGIAQEVNTGRKAVEELSAQRGTPILAVESEQPRMPTQPVSDDLLRKRRAFKNKFEAYAGERLKRGGAPDPEEEEEFNRVGIMSEVRRDRMSQRDMNYIRKRTGKFFSRAQMLADRAGTEEPESRARRQATTTASPTRRLEQPRASQSGGSSPSEQQRRRVVDERVSKNVKIDIDLEASVKGTSIDLKPIVKKINRIEYTTSEN